MGDGPVANLPDGLDVYAGYVNDSGIGETWPGIVERFPGARHVSITTNGSPAMVADVERGAMSSWVGYTCGYCSVSNVNNLISRFGRPPKLITAHQDPRFGAHICSPACWPGLVTTADGTQWVGHQGLWDESLLADDFFDFVPVLSPVNPKEDRMSAPDLKQLADGTLAITVINPEGHVLLFTSKEPAGGFPSTPPKSWSVIDISDNIGPQPNGQLYLGA